MSGLLRKFKQWLWGKSTLVLGGSTHDRCSDDFIINSYEDAGRTFGDMVSYLPSMGPADGFDKQKAKLSELEAEYIRRGYEPISLDDFVRWGGYGIEPANRSKAQVKP